MGLYEDRIFPWLLDRLAADKQMSQLTAQALQPARGEVLEIGFGSGRTVPLYPPAVQRLCAIEPSAGMTRRAQQRIAQAHFPVELQQLQGEQLPFENARFDTVVLVLTLCTVNDPLAVLREAKRVMKPDGILLFFEHVLAQQPRYAAWQHRINPVWKVMGCGCNLTRDSVHLMEQAGFVPHYKSITELEGGPEKASKMFPMLVGSATIAAH